MTGADIEKDNRETARPALLRAARRYGMSTVGPLAVSGAHFLASLIFLRNLSAHEFGLFSFVMVVVSFGMSLGGALIVVPITQSLVSGDAATRPVCYRMNWLVCGVFAVALALALWVSEAPLREALLLGGYAAAFAWRWFARSVAYIDGRINAAIASDIVYSLILVTALPALALTRHMTFNNGSEVMLLAALAALVPFGRTFFAGQLAALRQGSFLAYMPVFKDVSRWSMSPDLSITLAVLYRLRRASANHSRWSPQPPILAQRPSDQSIRGNRGFRKTRPQRRRLRAAPI